MGLNQYQFHETDSPFPLANRPIYWVKTVRLNDKTTQVNRAFWANRIDQIITKRLDRKGIIHTVSYARARELQAMSRYADFMLLHDARSTRDVIAQFRQAKPPCILVSPSVTTGVDFPYQDAEYQIIAKIPFPNTSTGLSRLRAEADKLWLMRTTCATLVQMSGRIVRGPGDVGETLIVDDTVNWLVSRYKPFLPMWWRQAYRPVAAPPMPPRKI
jgi:Rad3-related DNA helicase